MKPQHCLRQEKSPPKDGCVLRFKPGFVVLLILYPGKTVSVMVHTFHSLKLKSINHVRNQ